MKKLMIAVALVAVVGAFMVINNDAVEMRGKCYKLLEKESLTETEKSWIDDVTKPDIMKEAFVHLDSTHRALFKKHLGKDR